MSLDKSGVNLYHSFPEQIFGNSSETSSESTESSTSKKFFSLKSIKRLIKSVTFSNGTKSKKKKEEGEEREEGDGEVESKNDQEIEITSTLSTLNHSNNSVPNLTLQKSISNGNLKPTHFKRTYSASILDVPGINDSRGESPDSITHHDICTPDSPASVKYTKRSLTKLKSASSIGHSFRKPSSLFRQLRSLIGDYSRTRRDFWMNDELCKECYECRLPFTTFRRRHHCRVCGQIFCGNCANILIRGDRYGYPGDMRMCEYCSQLIMQVHEENDDQEMSHWYFSQVYHEETQRKKKLTKNGVATLFRSVSLPDLGVDDGILTIPSYSPSTTTDIVSPKKRTLSTSFDQPLNIVAVEFLQHVLDQLLVQSDAVGKERKNGWIETLMPLITEISSSVQPGEEDDLNINKYIKVKTQIMPSSSSSRLIHGVCFSGHISHKKMPSFIMNPRILLIAFPVEYERRTEEQPYALVSIEPVLVQEEEHLRNMIKRILAKCQPDVILVQHDVTRKAINMFLDSGVTVIKKVKASVMQDVSRCTGAEIVRSMNRFVFEQRELGLGSCDQFSVQLLADPDHKHRYCSLVEFEGCKRSLFGTIVLTGPSEVELKQLKEIVKFAVFVGYHLKLTLCLLGRLPESISHYCEEEKPVNDYPANVAQLLRKAYGFLDLMENKVLSISPCVTVPIPFVIKHFLEDPVNNSTLDVRVAIQKLAEESASLLSLYDRKSLQFLCGSYTLPKACQSLEHILIDLYSQNDICLGFYIEQTISLFCNEIDTCKRCQSPLVEHIKVLLYGDKKVIVKIEKVQEKRDDLVTWTVCQQCKSVGPEQSISNEAWHLSFATFIEMLVYNDKQIDKCCTNSVNSTSVRYFGLKNGIVNIQVVNCDLYHVSVPSLYHLAVNESPDANALKEYQLIFQLFFDLLQTKLAQINLDELAPEKLSYGRQWVLEAGHKMVAQKKQYFMDENTFNANSYRELLILIRSWEQDYSEFQKPNANIKKKEIITSSSPLTQETFRFPGLASEVANNWAENLDPVNILASPIKKDETQFPFDFEDEPEQQTATPSIPILSEQVMISPTFKMLSSTELQTDRSSSFFMKTLTSLLPNTTSSTLIDGIPQLYNDHVIEGSQVVVREEEPSSLIACTLTSSEYRKQIVKDRDVEYSLTHPDANSHVQFEFPDQNARFLCRVYFAQQFESFRIASRCDELFCKSLERCFKWDAKGGKSGSMFLKTRDERYVLKQLSKAEMEAFLVFAPSYFNYMAQVFFHDVPTLLTKIFGVYKIILKNPLTNRSIKLDLLVMENISYGKTYTRMFDLKGSTRNRLVQNTGDENQVLQDENLMNIIHHSPFFIRDYSRNLLDSSIWNDTLFLSKLNVMDYSLVVAVDDHSKALFVGLVDYIRTFTWDKKLESWVKESSVLLGSKEPTIVSPKQYMTRFRDAMGRYFKMVPDAWTRPRPEKVNNTDLNENDKRQSVLLEKKIN